MERVCKSYIFTGGECWSGEDNVLSDLSVLVTLQTSHTKKTRRDHQCWCEVVTAKFQLCSAQHVYSTSLIHIIQWYRVQIWYLCCLFCFNLLTLHVVSHAGSCSPAWSYSRWYLLMETSSIWRWLQRLPEKKGLCPITVRLGVKSIKMSFYTNFSFGVTDDIALNS